MSTAAKKQQKRVMEFFLISLVLGLLSLSAAGFMILFKKIITPKSEIVAATITHDDKKSILTVMFPSLKYSCSPFLHDMQDQITKNKIQLWNGICHSVNSALPRQISLTIESDQIKKKAFKGFKLANEIFYVFTSGNNVMDFKRASTFSTFVFAGATMLKGKTITSKSSQKIYLIGFGLGLGIYFNKNVELKWKNIDIAVAQSI